MFLDYSLDQMIRAACSKAHPCRRWMVFERETVDRFSAAAAFRGALRSIAERKSFVPFTLRHLIGRLSECFSIFFEKNAHTGKCPLHGFINGLFCTAHCIGNFLIGFSFGVVLNKGGALAIGRRCRHPAAAALLIAPVDYGRNQNTFLQPLI